jgi:stearoyl-CoA desaturase (delta-9 desaturase)
MADYARHVMKDVYRQERLQATIAKRKLFRRSRRLLNRHESLLDQNARNQLDELLNYSESLNVAYEFREKLQQLWSERTANNDKLLKGLQEWCHQAEETGIESLRDFAIKLRSYDSVTA